MRERQHKAELDAALEDKRTEFDKWKAQLEAETKIIIAGMSKQQEGEEKPDVLAIAMEGFAQALNNLNTPRQRRAAKGPDGSWTVEDM